MMINNLRKNSENKSLSSIGESERKGREGLIESLIEESKKEIKLNTFNNRQSNF